MNEARLGRFFYRLERAGFTRDHFDRLLQDDTIVRAWMNELHRLIACPSGHSSPEMVLDRCRTLIAGMGLSMDEFLWIGSDKPPVLKPTLGHVLIIAVCAGSVQQTLNGLWSAIASNALYPWDDKTWLAGVFRPWTLQWVPVYIAGWKPMGPPSALETLCMMQQHPAWFAQADGAWCLSGLRSTVPASEAEMPDPLVFVHQGGLSGMPPAGYAMDTMSASCVLRCHDY